ncbi:MAG: hypothetical protein AB7U63_14590 [Porticoccaceae bacterium]|mgnify:CR=1 FL=1
MTLKRKLVRTYGSHSVAHKPLPQEYEKARLRWLGHVRMETGDGSVDEYEIQPDRKLYLRDFLAIVTAEIDKLEDVGGADWRVDIFRLMGRS